MKHDNDLDYEDDESSGMQMLAYLLIALVSVGCAFLIAAIVQVLP